MDHRLDYRAARCAQMNVFSELSRISRIFLMDQPSPPFCLFSFFPNNFYRKKVESSTGFKLASLEVKVNILTTWPPSHARPLFRLDYSIQSNKKKLDWAVMVVSVLALYFDDPSSNPTEALNSCCFRCNLCAKASLISSNLYWFFRMGTGSAKRNGHASVWPTSVVILVRAFGIFVVWIKSKIRL